MQKTQNRFKSFGWRQIFIQNLKKNGEKEPQKMLKRRFNCIKD